MLEGLYDVLRRISEIQRMLISLYNPIMKSIPKSSNFQEIFDKKLNEISNKITNSQSEKLYYQQLIERYSKEFGVDRKLVEAIVEVESNYNPKAVSRRGACGLMQLLPQTAQQLGVKDIFNPEENIKAGIKYLKNLLEEFDNNIELALAAYNAGPMVVKMYGGVPPYKETQEYVKRVLELYNK